MREGESETVNQSQGAAAGGSGDSPEKLVADHVDRLWEHIAADGYDLLADVAVESLTRNGDVPPDAYLRAVKMSWCLHRAATYYARQYSVERVSADFARGDAQFEHSLRAQAERKAEKLEADLAQSVLLVESQRLRIEEARAQGAEWCRRIRELQDSLQGRRQEVSFAFASNEELQRQVEGVKKQEQSGKTQELPDKTQELQDKTQELQDKTQELQAEYTPPEGWRLLEVGEPLQNGDQWITESGAVEVLRDVQTEIAQPNGHYIRQIEPEVVQPLLLQDADVAIRMLKQCNQNQYEKIVSMREELNKVKAELAGAIQSRDLFAEANREPADKIAELQRQVEDLLTILGL